MSLRKQSQYWRCWAVVCCIAQPQALLTIPSVHAASASVGIQPLRPADPVPCCTARAACSYERHSQLLEHLQQAASLPELRALITRWRDEGRLLRLANEAELAGAAARPQPMPQAANTAGGTPRTELQVGGGRHRACLAGGRGAVQARTLIGRCNIKIVKLGLAKCWAHWAVQPGHAQHGSQGRHGVGEPSYC